MHSLLDGKKSLLLNKISIYAILILAISIFILANIRYYSLMSNVMDFGIFQNNAFNIDEWQRAFQGHIHPYLILIGLLYKKIPVEYSAYFLINLNVACVLSSICLIIKYLSPIHGLIAILYYPFWYNATFDFHLDSLAFPLLTLFYLFIIKRKYFYASASIIILMGAKEIFSLVSIGAGFYMIARYLKFKEGPKIALYGLVLVMLGIFYFYFQVNYLLPYFSNESPSVLETSTYNWLGSSLGEMLFTVFLNPLYVLLNLDWNSAKIFYFFILFSSLAFLPLLSPLTLLPCAPLLLVTLLANDKSVYYIYGSQYTAALAIPFIFASFDGFDKLNKVFNFYNFKYLNIKFFFTIFFSIILLSNILYSNSPLSRFFWSNKVWAYSFETYIPNLRNHWIKQAISLHIPNDINISVSSQNTLNWGPLSNRRVYLPFPQGVDQPYHLADLSSRTFSGFFEFIANTNKSKNINFNYIYADYVLIDKLRPLFLNDIGCNFIYNKCLDKKVEFNFNEIVNSMTEYNYKLIFFRDNFYIFKRELF